jgi:hypothetical protein
VKNAFVKSWTSLSVCVECSNKGLDFCLWNALIKKVKAMSVYEECFGKKESACVEHFDKKIAHVFLLRML